MSAGSLDYFIQKSFEVIAIVIRALADPNHNLTMRRNIAEMFNHGMAQMPGNAVAHHRPTNALVNNKSYLWSDRQLLMRQKVND